MASNYCQKCLAMFTYVNEQQPAWNPGRREYWRRFPMYEQLCHYSFTDIEAAATAGCPLCSKLHAWSTKHNSSSTYAGLDFSAEPNASKAGVWKFRFGVSGGDGEKRGNDEPSTLFTFTCHPLAEHVQSNDHKSTPLSDSTGSKTSLAQAKKWMERCIKEHGICSSEGDDTIYPPRLLDLRDSKVRLVRDTAAMKGTPYVALSHSWGPNPQQLTLTTDNQFSLGKQIEDHQLPPTFREAITATRALGFDYLWIDSLCIIQAGHEHVGDWLGHSAIMGSIYQNCALNIAAAHGHDASAGCFVTRSISEIAPCPIDLRRVTKIGNAEEDDFTVERESQTTPHLLVPEAMLTENVAHFHLDTRAWVCQERLLSPRTVYFAKQQLFWECSEMQHACETIPEGIPTGILPKPDEFPYMGEAIGQNFSWGTMKFDEDIPPFGWRAPSSEDQYQWWLKTLHGYVKRNLTKSSDKLPAVGGIAERTAKVLDDEYLAGIFHKQLPEALLWSRVQERRPRYPKDQGEFFAPSWSWASLNGDLDFTPLERKDGRTICSVLDSHVDLVDPENKFGQVKSASLTLRGPFATFDRKLLDDNKNWVYHFGQIHVKGFASKQQLLYFDFDPCTLEVPVLGLFLIRENARPYTYPGSGDMEEAGLVLAPLLSQSEKWQRIGVWKGIEFDKDDTRGFTYKNVKDVILV